MKLRKQFYYLRLFQNFGFWNSFLDLLEGNNAVKRFLNFAGKRYGQPSARDRSGILLMPQAAKDTSG
jgi:hypothetical protein